ncbi:hypothetical protein SAMN06265360_10644 [Haloechinothrix alba]|uniref:Uncharacterized protein n=1 Tax=Haloechinothrix alba TaxID=664784 RepID=A0A238WCU2_9PSEU|nr:hypothetical protein [Haloechinothrix alba]SNR44370.1 hypothetical protein SAMN06265360_10644 [Haloechinothrix alba]
MIDRCDLCSRTLEATGVACPGCLEGIGRTLAEIGTLYQRLDPAPGRASSSARGAPGFRSSSPARDEVIVLTDPASKAGNEGPPAVLNVLYGWWDALRDAGAAPPPDGASVARAVQVLAADDTLSALAQLELARPMSDELTELRRALRRACGVDDPTTPLGQCPIQGESESPCGGVVRGRAWGDPAWCTRCGTTWAPGQEMRRLATQLGGALADAPGVARYLDVAVSTVRTWAQRDGWTVHRHGRRRLYSLAEARRSLHLRMELAGVGRY